MSQRANQEIAREGWHLEVADAGLTPESREAVVAHSLAAARGELGAPRRRSRHASTWQVRIGAAACEIEIFIKLMDAPRGVAAIKRLVRSGSAAHVARITRLLKDSGFLAPPLAISGREATGGRELIVTLRADGDGPLRTLQACRGAVERKRALLHALGAEIARLHRCGFVHGDLTPFNIFFVRAEPPRFVFIDHERTRGTSLLGRRRRELRNLVQLGRFDLPGIGATDRMRILAGYTALLERREHRRVIRRVNGMLARRIRRDGLVRLDFPCGARR